jgi:membrane protein implicated in regulation of membrane protease activity
MTPRMRLALYGIVGVIGLILLFTHPLIGIILIAAAIAVPVVAWRALSPEQRRRIRENRRRKQIGG